MHIKSNIMDQEMEQRIWDYIDGRSVPAEKSVMDLLLSENKVWQNKYVELIEIHQTLKDEELEMPSLRFTRNVMEEIAKLQVAPAARNYINKNIIRGIGSFFMIMILGLFIYFVGQLHWSGSSSDQILPKYNLEAGKLNWGKILNNTYVNIFIGINVILGLILTDKYLQSRRNTRQTGH